MALSDDVEAFLEGFKWEVIAAGWDRKEWDIQLGPLLTRLAQAAYWALSREEARSYETIKGAILYWLEISLETYRQKFRAKKRPNELRPRMLAKILNDAVAQWIQLAGKMVEEVLNLIVLKQFINDLEVNTQKWVKKHQPKLLAEALGLVEDYANAKINLELIR